MYHKEILITLNNYKKRPLTNGLNFLRLEVEELVLGQRVHGHGGGGGLVARHGAHGRLVLHDEGALAGAATRGRGRV